MSKQILPDELAEIVTNLLVNPESLGELDEERKYYRFIEDIGRVVAEHCGGSAFIHVNPRLYPPGEGYVHEEHSPTLSVSPDDSLPSPNKNVWAKYDPENRDGWEAEDLVDGGAVSNEASFNPDFNHLRQQDQDLGAAVVADDDTSSDFDLDFICLKAASEAFCSCPLPDNWESLDDDEQCDWLDQYKIEAYSEVSADSFYSVIDDHSCTIKYVFMELIDQLKESLVDAACDDEIPLDLSELDLRAMIEQRGFTLAPK